MDNTEILTIRISRAALDEFIGLINEARVERDGMQSVFSYREHPEGVAMLLVELKEFAEV